MKITSLSKQQLADLYKVNVKTIVKRVNEFLDIGRRRTYYPKEVEKIFKNLGYPETKDKA